MSATQSPPASASPEAGARCSHCGRPADRLRRGWDGACYTRWLRGGRPKNGPPPPRRRGPAGLEGRLQDYVELTREHGLTQEQAAERLGVCVRTAGRYEARVRTEAPRGDH